MPGVSGKIGDGHKEFPQVLWMSLLRVMGAGQDAKHFGCCDCLGAAVAAVAGGVQGRQGILVTDLRF